MKLTKFLFENDELDKPHKIVKDIMKSKPEAWKKLIIEIECSIGYDEIMDSDHGIAGYRDGSNDVVLSIETRHNVKQELKSILHSKCVLTAKGAIFASNNRRYLTFVPDDTNGSVDRLSIALLTHENVPQVLKDNINYKIENWGSTEEEVKSFIASM